jgi:hypothetical protein
MVPAVVEVVGSLSSRIAAMQLSTYLLHPTQSRAENSIYSSSLSRIVFAGVYLLQGRCRWRLFDGKVFSFQATKCFTFIAGDGAQQIAARYSAAIAWKINFLEVWYWENNP